MQTLWHSYAKVHEPIELLFGVVNRVSSGFGVLDGDRHWFIRWGPCAPRGRGDFIEVLMSAC